MAGRYSVYGKVVDRGEFFVWDTKRASIVHPRTGDCSAPTPWALARVEEAEAAAARLNERSCQACDWYRSEGPPYSAGICWRFGGATLYRTDGCGNFRTIAQDSTS